MNLVVVSDLDGTLLDHETYSHAAAAEALALLRARGIPLVLSSSKTAAEIAPLRAELGFSNCPAIVENGAGLLEPEDGAQSDDGPTDYERLRRALDSLPEDLRESFEGFGDWSACDVSARTGLSLEAAARAMQRRFSEPGVWTGTAGDLDRFLANLAHSGISAVQGGRFLTLSFGADKAGRLAEIRRRYDRPRAPAFIVALGDAPNDMAMLEAADFAVIVANPAHDPLPALDGEMAGRIVRSRFTGPSGWNDSLLSFLESDRIRTTG